MRAKWWTWVMILLVVIMLVGVASSAWGYLQVDGFAGPAIGLGAIVLVGLGVWFLVHAIAFGVRTERLGRILDKEGGLPEDTVERSPGGRPNREQADEQFARYRAETEAAPEDWRSWYRLAVAYDVAGDRSRARKTMSQAITMERSARNSG